MLNDMRACVRCHANLLPHEQFGPNILEPMCFSCWQDYERALADTVKPGTWVVEFGPYGWAERKVK